jgi:hypothetical protein
MTGPHRLWRDRISRLLPVILSMAAPTVAHARPVFETCPPPPSGLKFGLMVSAAADGGVGGVPGDHHKELVCWTEKSAASGQNKSTSQNADAEIAADYDYAVNEGQLRASARVAGAVHNPKVGVASGGARVWVQWRDQLYFHSDLLPIVRPQDFINNNDKASLKAAESEIQLEVNILKNPPPSCSGETPGQTSFRESTGLLAVAGDIYGAGAMFGPNSDVAPAADTTIQLLRIDACGSTPAGNSIVKVFNGQGGLRIGLTLQMVLNGSIGTPNVPEGHLKVDVPNLGICIVKPKKPSDLAMTSASGIIYWCK